MSASSWASSSRPRASPVIARACAGQLGVGNGEDGCDDSERGVDGPGVVAHRPRPVDLTLIDAGPQAGQRVERGAEGGDALTGRVVRAALIVASRPAELSHGLVRAGPLRVHGRGVAARRRQVDQGELALLPEAR